MQNMLNYIKAKSNQNALFLMMTGRIEMHSDDCEMPIVRGHSSFFSFFLPFLLLLDQSSFHELVLMESLLMTIVI